MKEIKFQVYDKVCEEMYTVGDGCQLVVGMDGEKWSLWSDTGCIITNHDGILLQYTGLKDKNGREIYEGDIIVDGSVPGPEYGIGGYMFTKYEVKMVNGCFVVECIPDCVNDHVFGNYHLLYEVITDGFAEVIGNIYENPELLEVKTNNHKTV